MSEIGPIALFGSGETSPIAQRIHQRVMELLPSPIHAAIVETPAGFEPNSAAVAQKIIDYLEHRLQNFRPTSVSIPARKRGTACSPDDPEIIAPMLAANYLFMGPGSPTYAARQLAESYLWYAMLACHRQGAALCFSSASTLAISRHTMPVYEIYKVGEDLHWKSGLDFFGQFGVPLIIVPHWNNKDGGDELDTSHCYLGTARYEQLLDMVPTPATVLGLEENTGLIIQPMQGVCEVVGNGAVIIAHDGIEKRYQSKDSFPATELGDWQVPTDHTDLPEAIWQDVQSERERSRQEDEDKPPAEMIALAQKRTDARKAKDWATADQLRDELLEHGWQINDTADGFELSKVE